MPLSITDFTIARTKELKSLAQNSSKGIPTLIVGKPGTGKTHLLYKLMEHLRADNVDFVYIEKFKPPKEALVELCSKLISSGEADIKALKRSTLSELTKTVVSILESRKEPLILILDHLEDVTASTADILTRLSGLCVIFGACQFVRRARALKRFFWQFEIIELEPLSKDEARLLVERLITERGLRIKCRDFFINQVVANTSGIPLSIVETISRAESAKDITPSYTREMFIHGSGIREVDASPFVILIFSLFVIMRFVYRGFGDFQGYALFGALTGAGMFLRYMLYRQARRPSQQ